jgi:hypothetical protein
MSDSVLFQGPGQQGPSASAAQIFVTGMSRHLEELDVAKKFSGTLIIDVQQKVFDLTRREAGRRCHRRFWQVQALKASVECVLTLRRWRLDPRRHRNRSTRVKVSSDPDPLKRRARQGALAFAPHLTSATAVISWQNRVLSFLAILLGECLGKLFP